MQSAEPDIFRYQDFEIEFFESEERIATVLPGFACLAISPNPSNTTNSNQGTLRPSVSSAELSRLHDTSKVTDSIAHGSSSHAASAQAAPMKRSWLHRLASIPSRYPYLSLLLLLLAIKRIAIGPLFTLELVVYFGLLFLRASTTYLLARWRGKRESKFRGINFTYSVLILTSLIGACFPSVRLSILINELHWRYDERFGAGMSERPSSEAKLLAHWAGIYICTGTIDHLSVPIQAVNDELLSFCSPTASISLYSIDRNSSKDYSSIVEQAVNRSRQPTIDLSEFNEATLHGLCNKTLNRCSYICQDVTPEGLDAFVASNAVHSASYFTFFRIDAIEVVRLLDLRTLAGSKGIHFQDCEIDPTMFPALASHFATCSMSFNDERQLSTRFYEGLRVSGLSIRGLQVPRLTRQQLNIVSQIPGLFSLRVGEFDRDCDLGDLALYSSVASFGTNYLEDWMIDPILKIRTLRWVHGNDRHLAPESKQRLDAARLR